MKKLIPALVMLFFTCSLSAQYKKASFFGKAGRTYEVGSQMYFMGGGKGSPIGYRIGFGSERDGKRLFYFWDIQFLPSYKYGYNTSTYMDQPVTVNGTTKAVWIYGINLAYHLVDDAEGSKKLVPYAVVGISPVISNSIKEEHSSYTNWDKNEATVDDAFSMGVSGGLGCIFKMSSTLGLKLQGGYTAQTNKDASNSAGPSKPYYLVTSHPYVSVGLRLRIAVE